MEIGITKKMGISLKGEHLKRYKDIAALFMKYGRSELVKHAGLEEAVASEPVVAPTEEKLAEHLAADLEKMGPTFIKIGQLLSTRADILPCTWKRRPVSGQGRAVPFMTEAIVSSELGVRLSKASPSSEEGPGGGGLLGQVHRAALRDGRRVAVKVRGAGVSEVIVKDLGPGGDAASPTSTPSWGAASLLAMLRVLQDADARADTAWRRATWRSWARTCARSIVHVVPRPVVDYSTSRVLTTDYIRGEKITKLSLPARRSTARSCRAALSAPTPDPGRRLRACRSPSRQRVPMTTALPCSTSGWWRVSCRGW